MCEREYGTTGSGQTGTGKAPGKGIHMQFLKITGLAKGNTEVGPFPCQ